MDGVAAGVAGADEDKAVLELELAVVVEAALGVVLEVELGVELEGAVLTVAVVAATFFEEKSSLHVKPLLV